MMKVFATMRAKDTLGQSPRSRYHLTRRPLFQLATKELFSSGTRQLKLSTMLSSRNCQL